MSNSEDNTLNYSIRDPYSSYAAMGEETRLRKAEKILSVVRSYVKLSECDLLDIGTGSGHIIQIISRECKSATSVNLTDERIVKDGYTFRQVEDVNLPFPNESFHVVISNQVIEHIPPQDIHLKEIHRVLKKGGIAYIATPSKYALIEPHFKLPFLSWLPRPLANVYVKFFSHKRFDIYPLTYGQLNRMSEKMFYINDMSVKIIKNPKEFNLDVFPRLQPILKSMPTLLLTWLRTFFPSFIVILQKK
ncbi:MAG: class I SAM-dependent methyltransferase [Candidatus Omnitrophica bacterium]|nr:class I SAM-dependent methyltransferase [Candidatus Omnitrophota bacterium]